MGYFPVRYDSRVVIYERKMFIRLATGHSDYYFVFLYISLQYIRSRYLYLQYVNNTSPIHFLSLYP